MNTCSVCGIKDGLCPLANSLKILDLKCGFLSGTKVMPDDFHLGIVDPSTAGC